MGGKKADDGLLTDSPTETTTHTHTHLFRLSKVKPEPPPGAELLPLAEVEGHVGAGIAGDERGAIAAERVLLLLLAAARTSHDSPGKEGRGERASLNGQQTGDGLPQQRTVLL